MDFLNILDTVIISIASFLSITGNTLVIILISKYEYLQTRANSFVLCLAISDFCIGLVNWPTEITLNALSNYNVSDTEYTSWFVGCKLTVVLAIISYYGDYLSIAAITFDRFLYIKYPFKYNNILTVKRNAIIIITVFFLSISISIAFVFTSKNYRKGKRCLPSSFVAPIYFTAFDVPLLILITLAMLYTFYTYFSIAKKTVPQNEMNLNLTAQIKVTKVMSKVIGVFLVSNIVWYSVYFITSDEEGLFVTLLTYISYWLWLVSPMGYFNII